MEGKDIPPPGEGDIDPWVQDIDAVGFALAQTLSHLNWINEYAHSFADLREREPKLAEQELRHLLHATPEALKHARRLRDLLLAGHTFDPAKKLPDGLADA